MECTPLWAAASQETRDGLATFFRLPSLALGCSEQAQAILLSMAASVIIPIPRTQEDLEKVLGGLDRPDGVGRPRITFGADHSGDSSVWIVYPVSKSIPLTKQRIAALNSFAEGVRQSVRELQIDEITYVRFTETGRQAARP